MILPYFGAIGVALIFSIHYQAAKFLLIQGLHPLTLSAFRGIFGGLILLYWNRKSVVENIKLRRDLPSLILIGLVGFAANQIAFIFGLGLSTPVEVALISGGIPIASTLAARLVLKESVLRNEALALGIGFLSVGLHLQFKFFEGLKEHLLGDGLLLLSVILLAVSLALSKKLMTGLSPGVVAGSMLAIGGFALLPFSAPLGDAWSLASQNSTNAGLFLFEILVSTALAWGLNFWTIGRLRMSIVSGFAYLQLPFSVLLTWLINGTLPNLSTILAFFGLAMAGAILLRGQRKLT